MLSNDCSMSAKMLMHPKSIFLHYLSAPFVVDLKELGWKLELGSYEELEH